MCDTTVGLGHVPWLPPVKALCLYAIAAIQVKPLGLQASV